MKNIVSLSLVTGFIVHLSYWLYLLRTKKTERMASRKIWAMFSLLIGLMAIFQLTFQNFGKLQLFNNNFIKVLGLLCFLSGTSLSMLAKKTLGENWTTGWEYQVKKEHELITTGPFKFIRHPIYLGILLMSLGFELALSNRLFFLVLAIFTPTLYGQARREEILLEKHFGTKYTSYKSKTKMFFFL